MKQSAVEYAIIGHTARGRLKRLTASVVNGLLRRFSDIREAMKAELETGKRVARILSAGVRAGIAGLIGVAILQIAGEFVGDTSFLGVFEGIYAQVFAAILAALLFAPLVGRLEDALARTWAGLIILPKRFFATELVVDLRVAEEVLRRRPESVVQEAERRKAGRFADVLPRRAARLASALGSGEVEAVVLRNFVEKRPKLTYLLSGFRTPTDDAELTPRNFFDRYRNARNAVRVSLLLRDLGCELRSEIPSGADWRQDYFTNPNRPESVLDPGSDFPLRFHTAAPQYGWPNQDRHDSFAEVPLYRIITAVGNPAKRPLFVIGIDDVVEALPKAVAEVFDLDDAEEIGAMNRQVLRMLTQLDIILDGDWDPLTFRPNSSIAQSPSPILRNVAPPGKPARYIVRWDLNRVDLRQFDASDGEARRAFGAFVRASNIAGESALPIVLSRGDALIVDNLRCLVARRELPASGQAYWKQIFAMPDSWHLQSYRGFRASAPFSLQA